MASSSQPPVLPTTEGDKINFVLDIHVMRSLLHTIYSTDLIHRQPNEAQRSSYADKVSLLEHRITKIEEHLKKRNSVGRRLERFLTCRDRDYERFVALQSELNRVYTLLMINATSPTPPQKPTPESSVNSSKSGSSSDRGLWMAASGIPSKRRAGTDESISIAEQIEEFGPVPIITLTMLGSSHASERSGSSSTIKASRVPSLKNVDEERNIGEQARPPEISSSSEAGQATSKPELNFTETNSSSNRGLWIKKTNSKKGVNRESGLWDKDATD